MYRVRDEVYWSYTPIVRNCLTVNRPSAASIMDHGDEVINT